MIWLFLLHLPSPINGHFSPVEVAMTLIVVWPAWSRWHHQSGFAALGWASGHRIPVRRWCAVCVL